VLVALIAAGALFVSATPAQADTYYGRCYGNVEFSIWVDTVASYSVDASNWQTWYWIAGSIRHDPFAPNSHLGNQNNVDLYLYQDGAQNWARFSPDSIPPMGGFGANPNRYLPDFSDVQARVTGIFDKPWVTDPRCHWYSPVA
jgi:hypothetical protein